MRYIALVHLLKQRKQAQKIIEFLPRNSKFVILKPRHTTIHPTPKRLQSLKLWNMERYLFSLHKTRSPTMSFWNWKWGMENAKNVIENWRRISNRIKKLLNFIITIQFYVCVMIILWEVCFFTLFIRLHAFVLRYYAF